MARKPDTEKQCDQHVEIYLGPDGVHGCGVLRSVAHVYEAPLVADAGEIPASQYNADVLNLQCDDHLGHGGDAHALLLIVRENVTDDLIALDVTWRVIAENDDEGSGVPADRALLQRSAGHRLLERAGVIDAVEQIDALRAGAEQAGLQP